MPFPALVDHLVALAVPPTCVACAATVRAGAVACPACLAALPWLRGPSCPRCALPRHRTAGCPAARAAFERAWAPLAYYGTARALVGALKQRGGRRVANAMAAALLANLPQDLRSALAGGAVVVPVPAQRERLRARGFDPAGALAAALARRGRLALVCCLSRTDRAPRQAGADRAQRRRPGRVAVVARAPVPVRALLVDDVYTTGATLDACARALRADGARWVGAVSYARTL